MVGIASRYFAGRVTLAIAAAVALGIATGMDGEGNVVFYAVIVLGTAAAAFALLAALALAVGDDDSTDRERLHDHPASRAYWPVMSALGLGVLMVGLPTDGALTILGVAILVVAAVEWTISAWADRLSTDQEFNRAERNRLLAPFEIPLYGALAIAVPVFMFSRVLLASSVNGASWVAIAVSAAIVAVAFVMYLAPAAARRAVGVAALLLGGLGVIVAGIVAAAIGERDFHHHEEESHSEEDDHGDDHSGAPVVIGESD